MTIINTSAGNLDNNIAVAISAYADAAREDHATWLSTGIVGSDARITDAGESYTGTIRWLNYTSPTTYNKPSEAVSANDPFASQTLNTLSIGNQAEVYIKNVDSIAAEEASMQRVISKVDGLSYLGQQFGAVRAQREDMNLRSVIGGVVSKVLTGWDATTAADVDGDDRLLAAADTGKVRNGFVTDYTHSSTSFKELFEADPTSGAASARSAFFDQLLDAMAAVSGEFEEPFYYLVISANTYNVLRKQNVLDAAPVQDGNISFNTLLGGKIRLVLTGNALLGVAETVTVSGGTADINTSVLMKAGALAYQGVAVPNPTAIERSERAANGGGAVTILSRWGNIIHPRGYSFGGTSTAYPANTLLDDAGSWDTIATNVNQTGIFPIFHG